MNLVYFPCHLALHIPPPPPVSPVGLIGQSGLGPLMCLSGSPLSAISPPALGKALDKDRWPLTYSPLTPDWLSVCVDQISAPRHTKGYSFWNSTRTHTHTRTHTRDTHTINCFYWTRWIRIVARLRLTQINRQWIGIVGQQSNWKYTNHHLYLRLLKATTLHIYDIL